MELQCFFFLSVMHKKLVPSLFLKAVNLLVKLVWCKMYFELRSGPGQGEWPVDYMCSLKSINTYSRDTVIMIQARAESVTM